MRSCIPDRPRHSERGGAIRTEGDHPRGMIRAADPAFSCVAEDPECQEPRDQMKLALASYQEYLTEIESFRLAVGDGTRYQQERTAAYQIGIRWWRAFVRKFAFDVCDP
jgi:hypothetical protein